MSEAGPSIIDIGKPRQQEKGEGLQHAHASLIAEAVQRYRPADERRFSSHTIWGNTELTTIAGMDLRIGRNPKVHGATISHLVTRALDQYGLVVDGEWDVLDTPRSIVKRFGDKTKDVTVQLLSELSEKKGAIPEEFIGRAQELDAKTITSDGVIYVPVADIGKIVKFRSFKKDGADVTATDLRELDELLKDERVRGQLGQIEAQTVEIARKEQEGKVFAEIRAGSTEPVTIETTIDPERKERGVVEGIYTFFTQEIPEEKREEVKVEIAREAARTKEFLSKISKAVTSDIATERVRALRELYATMDMKTMSPQEVATFLTLFHQDEASREVVRVFEEAQRFNIGLVIQSEVLQEYYAVGLNYTKRYDDAIAFTTRIIEEKEGNDDIYDQASGEIYAARAKALREKSRALPEGDPAKRELLTQSYEDYKRGFEVDFEHYPGINAVYNLIELGNKQEALKLAKLVDIATQTAGGLQSTDYWCLASQLELSLIVDKSPDAVRTILDRVLYRADVGWKLGSTLKQLDVLRSTRQQEGEDVSFLTSVMDELQQRQRGIEQGEKYLLSDPSRGLTDHENKSRQLLERHGIHYLGLAEGPLAHYLGGNIEWKGQLHAEVINRSDIKKARAVLERLGLSETDDLGVFNQQVDALLREQFQTDTLEVSDGPQHDEYDEYVRNVLKFFDVDISGESNTNIMVDLELGRGDCRHHAYTKQLLFDVWKRMGINSLLRKSSELFAGSVSDDFPNSGEEKNIGDLSSRTVSDINLRNESIIGENAIQGGRNDFFAFDLFTDKLPGQVRALLERQMFILDLEVWGPIQTVAKYKPRRDSAGNLMLDGARVNNLLEDHTLNALIFVDSKGVQRIRLADAFYHNVYKFGYGQQGEREDQFMTLEEYLNLREGSLNLGATQVVDSAGHKIFVPLRSNPTRYAGDASKDSGSRRRRDYHIDDIARFRGFEVVRDMHALFRNIRLTDEIPFPGLVSNKKLVGASS